jgi:hypothetical protein
MSGNPSEVATALIAIGSAAAGGLITGGFTLLALRIEHQRDRAITMEGRSHDAARRVLEAMDSLDFAILDTNSHPKTLEALRLAHNQFASTLSRESPDLQDEGLRHRLTRHMELGGAVFDALRHQAPYKGMQPEVKLAWRSHGLAMSRSLAAHRNGQPLPAYETPGDISVAALVKWSASAEHPR